MVSETPQQVDPKASVGEQSANVAPNPDFPQLEHDVLRYWDTNGTFQKSIDENPSGEHSSNEFVFFDGPPFANGLPHYGHLLTGYAKDVVPRYQTMKGRRVNRVFGWDTHGLPADIGTPTAPSRNPSTKTPAASTARMSSCSSTVRPSRTACRTTAIF